MAKHLSNYVGNSCSAHLIGWWGQNKLYVSVFNGRRSCEVRVPDGTPTFGLVRSLLSQPDSVPAYALADAIRDHSSGNDAETLAADMIAATVRHS